MKIFQAFRTDPVGYDEYDAHIVMAENEESVMSLINEDEDVFINPFDSDGEKWEVIEIDPESEGVILSSFNAG